MPKGTPKKGTRKPGAGAKKKTESEKKKTKAIFKRVLIQHYDPLMEVLNEAEKKLKE